MHGLGEGLSMVHCTSSPWVYIYFCSHDIITCSQYSHECLPFQDAPSRLLAMHTKYCDYTYLVCSITHSDLCARGVGPQVFLVLCIVYCVLGMYIGY